MRKINPLRLVTLLLLGVSLSCSSTPAPSTSAGLDDDLITAEVRERISLEPSLRSAFINVQTSQGIVTLRGMVEDGIDRSLAESLASKVEGVKGVRNLLETKRQGRYPFFRRW